MRLMVITGSEVDVFSSRSVCSRESSPSIPGCDLLTGSPGGVLPVLQRLKLCPSPRKFGLGRQTRNSCQTLLVSLFPEAAILLCSRQDLAVFSVHLRPVGRDILHRRGDLLLGQRQPILDLFRGEAGLEIIHHVIQRDPRAVDGQTSLVAHHCRLEITRLAHLTPPSCHDATMIAQTPLERSARPCCLPLRPERCSLLRRR